MTIVKCSRKNKHLYFFYILPSPRWILYEYKKKWFDAKMIWRNEWCEDDFNSWTCKIKEVPVSFFFSHSELLLENLTLSANVFLTARPLCVYMLYVSILMLLQDCCVGIYVYVRPIAQTLGGFSHLHNKNRKRTSRMKEVWPPHD